MSHEKFCVRLFQLALFSQQFLDILCTCYTPWGNNYWFILTIWPQVLQHTKKNTSFRDANDFRLYIWLFLNFWSRLRSSNSEYLLHISHANLSLVLTRWYIRAQSPLFSVFQGQIPFIFCSLCLSTGDRSIESRFLYQGDLWAGFRSTFRSGLQ